MYWSVLNQHNAMENNFSFQFYRCRNIPTKTRFMGFKTTEQSSLLCGHRTTESGVSVRINRFGLNPAGTRLTGERMGKREKKRGKKRKKRMKTGEKRDFFSYLFFFFCLRKNIVTLQRYSIPRAYLQKKKRVSSPDLRDLINRVWPNKQLHARFFGLLPLLGKLQVE